MKITEAFDLYKNNYMFVQGQSKRVLENHDYVKASLVKIIGNKQVSELTMDDVYAWTSALLSHKQWNTVRNDVMRLRAVMKYLRARDFKCLNPALIPVPKREEITRDFLTAEEVASMIDCAPNLRSKFIISLLYSSGIRLSELLSLDRTSIQDRKFQVVGKGKKVRICFMDDRTDYLMRKYLESRDDICPALVVSYKSGERMTPTNVQLLVKIAARRAGITKRVTPHVLRHSFATNFIKNNGNIRYLSTMLGHASVSTTMVYTHCVDNDLEAQYVRFHST